MKQSTDNINNELINIIGAVALVSAIAYFFNVISRKTNTKIISNDARRVLQNQTEAVKLRKAVDTYHITGDWKKTDINEILK